MTSPSLVQYNPQPLAVPIPENGRLDFRPFQIVSLLDVIKFPAEAFLTATAILAAVDQVVKRSNAGSEIGEKNCKFLTIEYTKIKGLCEILGLTYAKDEVEFVLYRLENPTLTWQEFAGYPLSTNRRMRDEIKRQMCILIPNEDAKYYRQAALFGERVQAKFPSASVDIEAAGNCYATDNPTACVMHSMRVLELGVGALAKRFRVSFQHSNWDNIIGQIEKKIRLIEAKKRKPKEWRKERQFYSEAAIHFRFLKDGWRNYSMHVHENYDRTTALTIMSHVHEFMHHLSERLGE